MIKYITSKQNDLIKEVVKLSDTKYGASKHLFKVEGFHNLEMALEANVVHSVYVTKEIKKLNDKIEQIVVTNQIMDKITNTKTPQGVVAVCNLLPQRRAFGDKIIYLDAITDPGNLGTILRTALAFGYMDVILSKGCVSQYNEKTLQSAQGAIFKLNIFNDFDIKLLKDYQIIATEIEGSLLLEEVKPESKHILVLGNEGHGVSKEILKIADKRVRIDIQNIESLNVAIAGAIAMYKLSK